jgi:hypothetical protein
MANAPSETAEATLGAAKFYYAALSQVAFDPSGAYVALVSALECLAGHHYSGKQCQFAQVEKFKKLDSMLLQMAGSETADELCTKIREELLRNEYFIWQKFLLFITEHLPGDFWETQDELYPHNSAFPNIAREQLKWCLRQVYKARSEYVHGGKRFPLYVDFGTRQHYHTDITIELMRLHGQRRYLPPFSWFERLTHFVIIEFMLRSFAPDLIRARESDVVEKERLLAAIAALPLNVRDSLQKLTYWIACFVGWSIINPHAPNKEWADSAATVADLVNAGLVKSDATGLDGSSWLRNREVGEIVGEFFFGVRDNPFRGNELLLPKAHESLFDQSPHEDSNRRAEETP